ncbi:hypothetical protein L1049_028495 [Liquidambar formosana]|uniref:Uncharacterized protein n=1 Tax=Liquidambar formosana TaxID=63359 RepID=A0AAP0RKW9_LIQFO
MCVFLFVVSQYVSLSFGSIVGFATRDWLPVWISSSFSFQGWIFYASLQQDPDVVLVLRVFHGSPSAVYGLEESRASSMSDCLNYLPFDAFSVKWRVAW